MTITITVHNQSQWARINRNGEYLGNYLEWYSEEDLSPEEVEKVNKKCREMTNNGLGYFEPGEELQFELENL